MARGFCSSPPPAGVRLFMNRLSILAASLLLSCLLGLIAGCGGGGDGTTVEPSPAAVKADKRGQEAMMEYMKSQKKGSKNKGKGATKGPAR